MQINYLTYNSNLYNNYSHPNPAFGAKGQPISLKYIMEKHSHFLPKRVFKEVKKVIAEGKDASTSLLEIHKKLYSPILDCKNFAAMIDSYPEFSEVLPSVPVKRVWEKNKGRLIENFGLKVMQEYWGNLRTKDEIAQMLGMKNRSSLQFSLNKINFIGFDTNYRTLLNASDKAGNNAIAEKTKTWNRNNPERRRELNIHAAQGCKTEEYRQAQSQRMIEYDTEHPERREKISAHSKEMWNLCPEVKVALSEFSKSDYIICLLSKQARKQTLSPKEEKSLKIFYNSFWRTHPELKSHLSTAAETVRKKKQGGSWNPSA